MSHRRPLTIRALGAVAVALGLAASTLVVGAAPASAAFGDLIVSEFRASGPAGDGDHYVELTNTGPPLALNGMYLQQGDAGGLAQLLTSVVLPTNGTFLATGPDFSLGVGSDAAITLNLASGVRVYEPGPSVADIVLTDDLDLPALEANTDEHAWIRTQVGGEPQDTSSNSADFQLISTTGGAIGSLQSTLGTPAPTGTTSPAQRNSTLTSALLDPAASASAPPNRTYTPGVSGAPGTLTVRRTLTNTSTTTAVTDVSARITALSALHGAPKPGVITQPTTVAQLSVIAPAEPASTVTVTGGAQVTVTNLSPGSTAAGLNTELSVGDPLAILNPGATIDVAFTFAVVTTGSYWFGYDIEALNAPT